ncbi:hypothetical protein O3M35_009968 [Rhynocoris fuscipes]|uniref:Mitochondrial inner membrane protease ATP23 n=1 Tax=Rhynocoris fuscipes TaxID=488301 RepID=A0AAW1CX84_9HEMI
MNGFKEDENSNKSDSKDENNDKSESFNPSDYGYDLYPERKGKFKTSLSGLLSGREGNECNDRLRCEKTIYKCFQKSKIVQLMAGALKASGCPIDLKRHIACEVCDTSVSGGYDPELNQIVICQNSSKSEGIVHGILVHEMIHMFDYCNNKVDFKNLDHLACTEIRAANLTHCSFTSAMLQGDVSPWDFKNRHQDCVKTKALNSILAVRKVSLRDAFEAIERVFSKCYNDMEPIGRRMKPNSEDGKRAYSEGFLYGYV